jgi:hypothetical protein
MSSLRYRVALVTLIACVVFATVLTRRSAEHTKRQQLGENGTAAYSVGALPRPSGLTDRLLISSGRTSQIYARE